MVSFVDAAWEGLAGKQPRCYKAPVEPPQFCEWLRVLPAE